MSRPTAPSLNFPGSAQPLFYLFETPTQNFHQSVGAPYLAFNASGSQSGPSSSLSINYVTYSDSSFSISKTSNLGWTDAKDQVTINEVLNATLHSDLTMAFAVDPNTTYNYVYGVFLNTVGNIGFFWQNSNGAWSPVGAVQVSNTTLKGAG